MCDKPLPFMARLAAGLALVALAFTGCSQTISRTPAPPTATPRSGLLTPYTSGTPTPTRPPTNADTPTPLPSPTATPRTHTVVKGEDMFGIAWRYGLTLDELKAANPDVNPNLLSIGAVLVIPASNLPEPSSQPPTPTPIPVETGRLSCARSAEGGVWCFWLLHNTQDFALENVSAIFRLADQAAENIQPAQAFLPLDLLPPGASLPLVAYYPPPVPEPFQASAELASVLPNPPNDGRYLETQIDDQQVQISADGRVASISASVRLTLEGASAGRVWVVGVAYDANNSVVGVRRWENKTAGGLSGGETLMVQLDIYSLADPITRVDLLAEARP